MDIDVYLYGCVYKYLSPTPSNDLVADSIALGLQLNQGEALSVVGTGLAVANAATVQVFCRRKREMGVVLTLTLTLTLIVGSGSIFQLGVSSDTSKGKGCCWQSVQRDDLSELRLALRGLAKRGISGR